MAKVKILSIDPGQTATGWAISEYDTDTGKAFVTKRGEILGRKSLNRNKEQLVIFSRAAIILSQLRTEISELVRINKPNYVVTEDAFYNPRTGPIPFASLKMCICIIEQAVKDTANLPLFRMAPMAGKKGATGHGVANKLTVQEAILRNPNISIKVTMQCPLSAITEHIGDAMAVMWAFVTGGKINK